MHAYRRVGRRHARSRVSGGAAQPRPRTVALVAKTKTRTSGRVSNRFWKLLGASTDRDQARSMAQVRASEEFDEKAADLDDEQLRKATQLLNLRTSPNRTDIPQFLAIAREASERTTTLRPFDVQCSAPCGCWLVT